LTVFVHEYKILTLNILCKFIKTCMSVVKPTIDHLIHPLNWSIRTN